MYRPAVPICGFWCLKHYKDRFYGGFYKRPSLGINLHQYSLIKITLFFWGHPVMGSLLSVVINLSSIKDDDIGNLQKFEYLYDYL